MSEKKRIIMLGFHSPVDAKLMREWLTGLDYEVVESLDDTDGIDLVLMDSATARRLMDKAFGLKRAAKYFLPVLVCINADEDVGRWLKAGFDDVLHLPATKEEWRARIDIMLRLRRQSEELGQKSEYLHRALIQSSGDHIFLLDANGTYVTSNDRVAHFGLDRGDKLVGRTIEQVYPKEVAAVYSEQFQRVLTEGKTVVFEHNLPSERGTHYHLATLYPIKLPDGTAMVGGICRDITERKQAEKELVLSEQRYRSVFENTGTAMIIVNEDGSIAFANRQCDETTGYSPEELQGTNWRRYVFADDLPMMENYFRLRFSDPDKAPKRYEARMVHADGSTRNSLVTAHTIPSTRQIVVSMLDITERVQAQEAARRAWREWEEIFQAIGHPTLILSPQHTVLAANQATLKATGMTAEELAGKPCYEVFHGTSQPPEDCPMEMVMRSGRLEAVETEMEALGGTFLVSCMPVFDAQGELEKVIHIATDITERRQAEEALRKSDTRLKAAEKLAHLGYWELDLKENVLLWSDEIYRIFDLDPSQFCATYEAFLDMVHPDDRELVNGAYTASVANRTSYNIDHRILLKDGRTKYVHEQCETIYDEQGNAIRSLGTVQDITDRIRAEEDRRALETAIDNAQECIMVSDRENRLTYVNRAFEKLTGYSAAEALGNTPGMLKSGQHDREFYHNLKKTIYAGHPWQGNLILRKKNGEFYEAYVTITPICDQAGIPEQFVSVHRDVTKEREVERRIQQNQRLEAIGTLAGGIAHDFNNLLSPIIGYTELCMLALPTGSKVKRHLEEVMLAANRATELVKQILSFSRRSSHERKPLQMAPIIKEALKLLRSTIPTSIEFRQDISATEESVIADPTKIHQVIMNLCINASHAMPDGGLMSVGLHAVDLDQESSKMIPGCTPGRYLKLSVEDTGHGIAPEILDKIFEPYFTTKKEGLGTGLGLATTHSIVAAYGGGITVYSEQGKGTRFNVYFPVVEDTQTEKVEKATLIRGGHERILFIDDDPAIVELGKSTLEQYGYSVTTSVDPVQALELFKNAPDDFDMVITDMTMPHMTGDLLAAAMLKIRPDLPVVVLTGFSERMNEDKAQKLGIRRLLTKPITPGDLLAVIREIFDREE